MGNKFSNKIIPISKESDCIICLDDNNIDIEIQLECNHKFHEKCLKYWIIDYENTTCPICRDEILDFIKKEKPEWLKKKKNKIKLWFLFITFIYGSIAIPLSYSIGKLINKSNFFIDFFSISFGLFFSIKMAKIIIKY